MSQPAFATPAPAPFLRRAFDWSLEQVKHALPPTIFFFVGFNLILWTKRLILEEHGIEFSGFFTATVAALLVGKAVLVTDNLPFMRRFDGAPVIQPILFKTAIYWLCVLIVRLAERARPFSRCRRHDRRFPGAPHPAFFLVTLFVDSDMADGADCLSTSRYMNSTCSSATANSIAYSSAGARLRPSLPAVSAFACSPGSTG